MKRSVSVEHQVFSYLYPFHADNDPPSWEVYCKQHILPEVRKETGRFYGEHESMEAKYPGLDYRMPHHRRRLARFPHHRRLFDTFDALNLSPTEIYQFCNWEGTLLVKERYEAERHIKILDTTGADVPLWQDPPPRAETPRLASWARQSQSNLSRSSTIRQSTPRPRAQQHRLRHEEQTCIYSETEEGEVDDGMESETEGHPGLPVPGLFQPQLYTNDITVRQRQHIVRELLQARARMSNDGQQYSQEWRDHFRHLADSSGWDQSVQNVILQGVMAGQGPPRTRAVSDTARHRRRSQQLVNS